MSEVLTIVPRNGGLRRKMRASLLRRLLSPDRQLWKERAALGARGEPQDEDLSIRLSERGGTAGRNFKTLRREAEMLAENEIIDSAELAKRWGVPETWVRDQVRRRALDPIPHVRFGKYIRFEYGSELLIDWLARRRCSPNRAGLRAG